MHQKKYIIGEMKLIKLRKKVSFDTRAYLILIPCLNEYNNHNLTSILWYNNLEYRQIMNEYMRELHLSSDNFPQIEHTTKHY